MTSARLFPLGGIAFVPLIVASVLVAGETPASGASADEVASFYGDDEARQWVSTFLLGAAAPFAVLFGVGQASEMRSRWADVVRAGAILVAVALLLAASVHVAIADGGEQGVSDVTLQALNVLDGNTWIAMTSSLGVLMLGYAGAMLATGAQRVLGWSALVLGVALYLPLAGFIAMLASAVWIVVASIVTARVRETAEAALDGMAVPTEA